MTEEVVKKVKVVIGGDSSDLEEAASRSRTALGRLDDAAKFTASKLDGFSSMATKWGVGLSVVSGAVAGAATAAYSLASGAAEAGDKIAKSARQAGVSTDYFQEMSFALGQITNLSGEEVSNALTIMTRKLGEAKDGSKTAADALTQLGFSQDQIANGSINSEQVLDAFIVKMGQITDPAQAAALSTDIFGKAGARLGPQLMGATGEIDGLRARAQELGLVLSGDALNASEEFADASDQMSQALEMLKVKIGVALLPVLVDTLIPAITDKVIPAISSFIDVVGQVIGWFQQLPAPVTEFVSVIVGAFAGSGPILLAIGGFSKALSVLIASTGPVGLMITAASLLIAAWQVWGDDIIALVQKVAQWFTETWASIQEATNALVTSIQEGFTNMINWITEQFNAFITFLTELPDRMIQIGSDIIQGLLDGIMAKWEELKAAIYSIGDIMPEWMRDAVDSHSPSRVFQAIGRDISAGLGLGITESTGIVTAAVEGVADKAVRSSETMTEGILGAMDTLFEGSKAIGIARALISTWQGAAEALTLPWPKNLIAFAKVVATGLGAVANIKSTKKGSAQSVSGSVAAAQSNVSSGGGSTGGSSQAAAAQPVVQQQVVKVSVLGQSLSNEGLDALFNTINQGVAKGYQIKSIERV